MSDKSANRPQRLWPEKFRDAFRGLKQGVRGQSSFFVHFFVAAAVVAAGLTLGVDRFEWSLLVLSIGGVLAAEMFNSALESMAKAITHEPNPHLGGALDIGSAAVLIAAVAAVVVGSVVFLHRFGVILGWWRGA
jgi:diacylglycerol kinase